MMRRERRAAPLFALFIFELVAIAGLSYAGKWSSMSINWHDISGWLSTSTVDEIVLPILRYSALLVAYWMLISTILFGAAQMSKVPFAIRAAGMFTLPSVRRAVDGAMAVSIATTSVVGFAGAAVSYHSADSSASVLASLVTSGDNVGTPYISTVADSSTGSSLPSTPAPSLGDSTSTSAPDSTTSTSGVGQAADPTTSSTTQLAPSAGQDFVATPKPGAPLTSSTTTPPKSTTSTTTPAPAPAPAAPSAPAPSTTATNPGEHRVVPGDNLWTISRDAIAQSTGRSPHQIGEAEIRTYWLKVIDANRDHLRSHDPHWIFPGEVIQLPAVSNAAAK